MPGPVPLDLLDDGGDRVHDLPRRRMLEVELHESGEPIAQVAVQGGFDHGPQLA